MRIAFAQADFEQLAKAWNAFYPEANRIDAALLRLNTVESSLFDWGSSFVELSDSGDVLGMVAVKRSANPSLFRGPDPDQCHLTAFTYREANYGIDMLAEVKHILRDRGCYRLVFGADSRHFFPGCPQEFPALQSFLQVAGFEGGGTEVDLERDLVDYEAPAGTIERLGTATARPCTASDLTALDLFLEKEFPGRWEHDVMDKIKVEHDPGTVVGLFENDECVGFALIQQAGCRQPIGGAVWNKALGSNWGSLGPIGVSQSVRGRGLGGAILAAGLLELKRRGARRTIIDWTTLVDFYGKHGFEVSRRYTPMSRRLDEPHPNLSAPEDSD